MKGDSFLRDKNNLAYYLPADDLTFLANTLYAVLTFLLLSLTLLLWLEVRWPITFFLTISSALVFLVALRIDVDVRRYKARMITLRGDCLGSQTD